MCSIFCSSSSSACSIGESWARAVQGQQTAQSGLSFFRDVIVEHLFRGRITRQELHEIGGGSGRQSPESDQAQLQHRGKPPSLSGGSVPLGRPALSGSFETYRLAMASENHRSTKLSSENSAREVSFRSAWS